MKLKTARLITRLLFLGAIIVLMGYGASPSSFSGSVWLILAVLFGAQIYISSAFLRCPHCKAALPRHRIRVCPQCGEPIDENDGGKA